MAQHDYVIANGTGSAVRSDLNDALAAIVSMNSGSTEPSTTFAFQFWADTNANLLKMRNSANDGWIELRQLDGEFTSVSVANGTAAAPSIFFNASGTDTGIYSNGTDSVDVSTGGTRRLDIGSAGDVTVRGGNVTLNAQGDLRLADSDSSNWVAFQAPATVASNVTWTLPATDGTSGQALSTNGSGTLSWSSVGGDKIEEGNTSAEVVDTGSDGHFKVVTEGTEALRIDSSQRVGIGTTSPGTLVHVAARGAGGKGGEIKIQNSSARQTGNFAQLSSAPNSDYSGSVIGAFIRGLDTAGDSGNPCSLIFGTGSGGSPSEKARLDESGRLLVGTSTSRSVAGVQWNQQIEGTSFTGASFVANTNNSNQCGFLILGKSRGTSVGSNTIVNSGDTLGEIIFSGADGTDLNSNAALIRAQVDGTPGSDDMPGRLIFSTTPDGASSPAERMRIDSEGVVRCGNNLTAARRDANGIGMKLSTNWPNTPLEIEAEASGTRYMITFYQGSTPQGRIETSSGSTSYVTSSDYRLKENIVPVTDGIERLLQLKPNRFNFIAHPSKTVDGFLAHEVQDIVPEAISGEKDAVEVWQEGEELPDGVSIGDNKLDEDGNTIPKYQGIDQSKLVPLLTAALQEAIGKIETLETANASLEARLTALENA